MCILGQDTLGGTTLLFRIAAKNERIVFFFFLPDKRLKPQLAKEENGARRL